MITLTAKINLLSGDNKALKLVKHNLSGNNISSDLNSVVGVKKQGGNPFILGVSKLGDGSTLTDKVDYFIGDQLSDENGDFAISNEIVIESTKPLNNLIFSFDKVKQQYPNIVKVYNYVEKVITKTETITSTVERTIRIENTETPTWQERLTTDETGNEILVYDFSVTFDKIYIEEELSEEESKNNEIIINLFEKIQNNEIEDIETNMPFNDRIEYRFIINGDGTGSITLTLPEEFKNYEQYLVSMYFSYTQEETITETITKTETIYEKSDLINSYSDDAIFTLTNLGGVNSCLIEISDWNTPNSPLVITGIYVEVDIEIDRRNLISISRSIFDRSDLKLPSWGIISNTGSIEFNDTDGEILDYAEQLLLGSGLNCEIFLNNTLANAQERIGLFETDEWDYDNDNRVVRVSIKDDLEEWQEINVSEISYDPRNLEHKPLKWLYEHLWALTKDNYDMLAFDELDTDTQDILQNTYTQYPLLESCSLWTAWEKLCEVCQLHIYKNNDGVVVCRYNGGN